MPIYEYRCRACDNEFEAVVLPKGDPAVCPGCKSDDLERLLSLFAVSSDGTRAMNLQSARKKASKVRKDKEVAEHEMIHHHHH
jgi:putative FmdB family regulatory protein